VVEIRKIVQILFILRYGARSAHFSKFKLRNSKLLETKVKKSELCRFVPSHIRRLTGVHEKSEIRFECVFMFLEPIVSRIATTGFRKLSSRTYIEVIE